LISDKLTVLEVVVDPMPSRPWASVCRCSTGLSITGPPIKGPRNSFQPTEIVAQISGSAARDARAPARQVCGNETHTFELSLFF
jgi:hypothetical protein